MRLQEKTCNRNVPTALRREQQGRPPPQRHTLCVGHDGHHAGRNGAAGAEQDASRAGHNPDEGPVANDPVHGPDESLADESPDHDQASAHGDAQTARGSPDGAGELPDAAPAGDAPRGHRPWAEGPLRLPSGQSLR